MRVCARIRVCIIIRFMRAYFVGRKQLGAEGRVGLNRRLYSIEINARRDPKRQYLKIR